MLPSVMLQCSATANTHKVILSIDEFQALFDSIENFFKIPRDFKVLSWRLLTTL